MSGKKYRDYFDIDPLFFPSVNEKLINSGMVSWKNFYPHESFVKLLEKTIVVLSGQQPLSIVVEGEYGTGKSYAALTIRCMLDATDEEIEDYFNRYGLSRDLCQKFITVKNAGKIITVHRIGSSSIHSDQDLILAMQTSIMAALTAHGTENRGEASLKDAALKWLDKKANHDYFNELISEDKYAWTFGGRSVDELIAQLRSGSADEVAELMRDIMAVAEDNGITALRLDIQGMAAWIESVIEQNHLTAILFIWDEFSEYFQNNPNSLTGFQTLVEISETHPFYFMVISHQFEDLFPKTETAKKIQGRFAEKIKIELPENMAFQLMAQAMRPTSDVVLFNEWQTYKTDLINDLEAARNSVRDGLKRSATLGKKTIISDEELQGIVPIHPYAGLLLKHLAVLFSSNQRSMFDFIINEDADMKGFKWFIARYGPLDNNNLLTVDLLWDFFRGKGESGINEDVRVILDSYELLDSEKLTPDEQRVMKTVLLLEATSMRVSDSELLKPNAENVELAFSGTDWHKGKARSIAEKLVRDGLIFPKPVGGGKREYAVANSKGDIRRIREIKAQIIKETKTQDLIVAADLLNAIQLPAPIAGRFIMEAAVAANFTNELNKLEHNIPADRFNVMVTFALNDDESAILKDRISRTMYEGKTAVLIINAGITPMGAAMFEEYAENMAYSRYYAQSDRTRAAHYQNQANKYLSDWKYKVQNGPFMLYDAEHPSGQRMANQAALQFELGALNHSRYPCGLEQYNVIANMFSKGPLAQGAECGITQKLSGTFKSANEKTSLSTALAGAWQAPDYWKDPSRQSLPIVRIKREVERLIHEGFAQNSGRVSMLTIYDALTQAPFGFMPNNISAFVLGFVMKEYANGDYFWSNGMTNAPLTTDKLKTMIANAINERAMHNNHFREEFLVTMSEQQQAFLKCTAAAFHISESQCGSIESARDQLRISMKKLSFPIW